MTDLTTAPARAYPDIALSRTLARISDDLVTLPGTGIGIGADAIVGLIPGIGDVLGTGLSGVIMVDALRQRVPLLVIARMGINLLLDVALGFLPVVGDVADVAHRANRKNYRLLELAVAQDRHVDADVPGYLGLASAMVVAFVVAALALAGLVLWGLASGLGTLLGA